MSQITGHNRISALKRLSKSSSTNNTNRRQLVESKSSSLRDARELSIHRNQSSFDARQLLTRQSSKTFQTMPTDITVRRNLVQNKEFDNNNNGKVIVVTGLKDMRMQDGQLMPIAKSRNLQVERKKKIFAVGPSTFVTIRNNSSINTNLTQLNDKISLTKTIKNPSVHGIIDDRHCQTVNKFPSLSDQKVVISVVNDKYEKSPKQTQSTTTSTGSFASPSIEHRHSSPIVKRLHDASIQTMPSSSSSRSPIRMNSHRRHTSSTMDDDESMTSRTIGDDLYEPPLKRTTALTRKTTTTNKEHQDQSTAIPTSSIKRTAAGVPVNSRVTSNASTSKPTSTTQLNSSPGIILVTNLQASVTEEDVVELFSKIGRINEIRTLSEGCIRITYAKHEYAEQAVIKYHNRLLDGQFMYVSLQHPSSYSTSQSLIMTNNTEQLANENGTSISSSSTNDQSVKINNSKKIVIDPMFIRQALFHPSNNTANPVQFQVKL